MSVDNQLYSVFLFLVAMASNLLAMVSSLVAKALGQIG